MTVPPVDRAALVATLRDLHQHPELGFEERRTGALVAERLQQLGYTVRTGVGKTGVLAQRDGAPKGASRDRQITPLNSSHLGSAYVLRPSQINMLLSSGCS